MKIVSLFRFFTGIAVALAIHFMLYRISLPLKPFIYVAF